ncbi:MAG TPA: hypothetical protein VFK73_03710, partial [Paludibacter sp.]|nr:hypothetical protein [Paludibacter sp.]
MRTKHFILIISAIVLVISSCVIREPEDKSTLTEPGWSMFCNVEPCVIEQIQTFDKMLFVDSYLNTPDSLKKHYFFDNFGQYSLTVRDADYIFKMDKDTSYVITTDAKSIHSVGTEWVAKGNSWTYYMTVQCLAKNKWRLNIHPIKSYYSVYPEKENLEIQCTDTVAPKRFRDSDFSVSGDAVWIDNSRYDSEATLNYTITSPLKYVRKNRFFSEGEVIIAAVDSVQNK